MKTPYLTNPEGVFNKDLLETIDINELQNLVIQTRHRLEEHISSQSPTTSMFIQITHLATEAEAANELSIKSHKFQEASNLAFKLAQEYQENNLIYVPGLPHPQSLSDILEREARYRVKFCILFNPRS